MKDLFIDIREEEILNDIKESEIAFFKRLTL